ncbi:MAG: TolC family protein, partial [Solimonas sp.]
LASAQKLDVARAQAAQARRLVNLLRAQPDDTPLNLPSPETLDLPTVAAPAARPRPELRQLDQNLSASEAGERAARAAQWPTLGLAADYGIQGEDYRVGPDDDFDTVSLVLRWSLWDSGSRSAQRGRAAAQSAGLRAEREDLLRRMTLARRAAEENLATALRAIESGTARLTAAEESFRIAERKRAAAALSQIEFLDAERALREARLSLAIARCDALDRSAELELASASYTLPDSLLAP